MLTLDYFLYDNRTWAPRIGRDWGIKAATGLLASRSDLQSSFDRYCSALPGGQGYLSGFGQALGGFHERNGKGYLLCLTLETSDPFGRPSWAVYGLWCPDAASLENALGADLIAAVQAILRVDAPPSSITLTSSARVLPAPRRLANERAFRRFDRKSSTLEVVALLHGAIRTGAALPEILGITASSRLSELGQQYNVVYCHPLDDRGERAFEQHCRSDDLAEVETVTSSYTQPSHRALWAAVLGIVILITVALLIIEPHWLTFIDARAERPPASSAHHARLPVNAHLTEDSLRAIRAGLEEIKALDPEDLRSAGRNARSDVRKTCSALIEHRERIVGSESETQVQSPEVAMRIQEIRSILSERRIESDVCTGNGAGDSIVRRWCESFAKLERAVQSLPEVSSGRKSS